MVWYKEKQGRPEEYRSVFGVLRLMLKIKEDRLV
jgi:hypothetical protein